MAATSDKDIPLINGLLSPQVYNHPTEHITLHQTHISWVLCTGPFAYKLKKPVNLGFLDFSTLARRLHFCEEELRLNKVLAPELYLAVVKITGPAESPQIDGDGAAIEYAVKMIQFDNNQQFDRLLPLNQLEAHRIKELAEKISAFHETTEKNLDADWSAPEKVHNPVQQNYCQAIELSQSSTIKTRLQVLLNWHNQQYALHEDLILRRQASGYIRECHGDLHLANIALINNNVVIFDRIEFDINLRMIDIVSEIAFLLMDLEAHQQHGLAYNFINHWLALTGDYTGLNLLTYYKAYRAMVRAKIALISDDLSQFTSYLDLTETYTSLRGQTIIITHGLSGSGKSSVTKLLAPQLQAIVVRSDIERKRHFSARGDTLYSEETTRDTYRHMTMACSGIINAGYNAILDATFLQKEQRQLFLSLAEKLGVHCIILDCYAPVAQLEQWIIERSQRNDDPSDATVAVLHHQLHTRDALRQDEHRHCISIDTSKAIDIDALATRIINRTKTNEIKS